MEGVSVILDEGPIARSYFKLFKIRNCKFKNIFQLNSTNFFFRKFNLDKKKKNFYALKFIKSNKFNKTFEYIEKQLSLENNFIKEMYLDDTDDIYENKIHIHSSQINSEKISQNSYFNDSHLFLNTSSQIIKNKELLKKKIIHVHPAKLPEIKGADGSLWQMLYYNFLSCTVFYINNKIDEGEIIYIKNFDIPKLDNLSLILKSDIEKYRFWFSFVDPALRASTIDTLFFKKKIYTQHGTKKKSITSSSYYSFMPDEKRKLVFSKIFT